MTPRLYLLARPVLAEGISQFLEGHSTSWVEQTPARDAERLVEFAGRVCYFSFGENQHRVKNLDYVQNLIEKGHESVVEHAVWSFVLTGVSRGFTHQLVRHRVGFSFSQLSQQYHDEADAEFVQPFELGKSPRAAAACREAVEATRRAYQIIKQEIHSTGGIASKKEASRSIRSAARSVLPNATATEIVVTANARAIRHFLDVRGAIEGDYEMRTVSKLLLDMMRQEAPNLVSDFENKTMVDGTPFIVRRRP